MTNETNAPEEIWVDDWDGDIASGWIREEDAGADDIRFVHADLYEARIAELERLVEYVAFFCKKCGLRVFYEDGEWQHESYPEGVLDLDHKIVPEPEEYPS